MKKSLIVLSGGQDSVTCLAIAIDKVGVENVYAIGFNYGQKHKVEMECALTITKELGIPFKVVDLSFFGNMVSSALTSKGNVNEPHAYKKNLPASFVPNRNALFLTVAHAYAQEIKADTIYTGVCETDYSGYPDCRLVFIENLQGALNIGYETNIKIKTPLMFKNKEQTFAKANELGFLDIILKFTHTCYEGNHTTFNEWGYGCGECPSCKLRANGYSDFIANNQ